MIITKEMFDEFVESAENHNILWTDTLKLIGVTVGDVPDDDVKDYWYRQGKDDGVQVERERIVAWLRDNMPSSMADLNYEADAIEAGEHLT